MIAEDIVKQLHAKIPIHTDLFSTVIGVSSLTFSAGTVTVTTSVAHNLSTGDFVVITDALSPNPITSLTQVDGIATAETTNDHDLTKGWPDGDKSTINITGAADSEYNGDKELLDVPNRTKFIYEVDSGAPASTTGGILNEILKFSYNGFQQITVTSPTTYTYTILNTVGSPATGTTSLLTKTRISSAANIEKAIRSYTPQADDNFWAFVVLDPVLASKSRQSLSDSTDVRQVGTDPRQRIIEPFSVYVLAPAKNEIAARSVKDKMHSEVMISLFKSLLGLKLPSSLCEIGIFSVTFEGHETFGYTESTYIHRFQFTNLVDIVYDDTLREDNEVAFRDIHIDYIDPIITDGDDIIMTSDINLDVEP